MSEHLKSNHQPYAVVGAGPLVSTIWKRGHEQVGWQLRFSIARLSSKDGGALRVFRPADVVHLAKLCQVLAATFVDDGCISPAERQQLQELAGKLDAITTKEF